MAPVSTLRPITQKLTSTPVQELPNIAQFLASSISNCSETLSAPQSHVTSQGGEDAALVHKLKTRISSLLQDRAIQGRWTAVVVVKAVIEAGGWEILRGCEPWARQMLSILGKPDPTATKKLVVIALTRIFILTQPYPTLLREITTPLLPAFVTACLNLLSGKGSKQNAKSHALWETVLEAMKLLLPHHPATFRPFAPRIHQTTLQVFNDKDASERCSAVARELFCELHYCAAKNAAGSEWENAVKVIISSIHVTADEVFRAVLEDWESTDEKLQQRSVKHDYEEVVGSTEVDPLGLPEWEGIRDGSMRIIELLKVISTFLRSPSASQVSVPVGGLLDMTSRLCAVLVPQGRHQSIGPRNNPEVGREEREELFLYVPTIHLATLDLFSAFTDTLQSAALPVLATVLDQASWVFTAESGRADIRNTVFDLVQGLLPLIGPSVSKADMKTLAPIFRKCAQDLVSDKQPKVTDSDVKPNGKPTAQASTNADSFTKSATTSGPKRPMQTKAPPVHAWDLLPRIYHHIPSPMLVHSLRTDLDRTAILVDHQEALLASTLNPPPMIKGKPIPPSLLPFLARTENGQLAFEALLRPRMPFIAPQNPANADQSGSANNEDEDEDEESAFPFKLQTQQSAMEGIQSDPSQNHSTSLLDQLEESLPAASTPLTQNTDSGNITSTSTSRQPGQSSLLSPQKRDYSTISDPSISQSQLHETPLSDLQSSLSTNKKLKSEDQTSSSSALTVEPNIFTENIPSSSYVTVPENINSLPSIQEGGSKRDDEEDEEESDFEIPEINMEPDTDDEIEEDDDDEDDEMEG